MNSARITVVTNFDSSRPVAQLWCAWLYVGQTVVAQAYGRDEGAARADVIAAFRMGRACRRAAQRGLTLVRRGALA